MDVFPDGFRGGPGRLRAASAQRDFCALSGEEVGAHLADAAGASSALADASRALVRRGAELPVVARGRLPRLPVVVTGHPRRGQLEVVRPVDREAVARRCLLGVHDERSVGEGREAWLRPLVHSLAGALEPGDGLLHRHGELLVGVDVDLGVEQVVDRERVVGLPELAGDGDDAG